MVRGRAFSFSSMSAAGKLRHSQAARKTGPMRMKRTVAHAALITAVIALSGCAKGGRELKEGMAAELRGDWAAAEASYSASAMAGNGEACRRLAELWAGPRTEELLSLELKDAAWRDAVRSSMVKLANLGHQAEERGVPVEGVEPALVRLQEAIESSEKAERAAREAEERRLEEERRTERIRQLEERMAPLKTQRSKLDRERERLSEQIKEAKAEMARCDRDLNELKDMYSGPEGEKRLEALAFYYQVELGIEMNQENAFQLGQKLGHEHKRKKEELEHKKSLAESKRKHLETQLKEVQAQLEECDEELSSLQTKFDSLNNGKIDVDITTPPVSMDASENSADGEVERNTVETYNEMHRQMDQERHKIAVLLREDIDEAQ